MRIRVKKFMAWAFQKIRIYKHEILSDNLNVLGFPLIMQPTIFAGKGKIKFGEQVKIGFYPSPFFYSGSTYLEARNHLGNNVFINNNFNVICDKTSVLIGDNVLIGYSVNILDSDFHSVNPINRITENYNVSEVVIGNNVFIGSCVTILKGVRIGDNSVIAFGSVVTKSFPENVIIAGNPAKLISIISNEVF